VHPQGNFIDLTDNMLAWDIETTGLSPQSSLVTVAAIYSPFNQVVFQFATLDPQGTVVKIQDFDSKKERFMKELDDAPILAAFNGIGFDIPFITVAFDIAPERVMKWVLKSVDIFETCKRAFDGRTFGLNLVLALNGYTVKTGNGMEAVHQANAGKWEELSLYCMEDSRLTYEISTRERIAIPEGFQWRKRNSQRTHDPANILYMNIAEGYQISFEAGTLYN